MRILDEDNDKSLGRVTLFLTDSEASELKDALDALLTDSGYRHEHISDYQSDKELTVCIYRDNLLKQFNERSRQIINKDE